MSRHFLTAREHNRFTLQQLLTNPAAVKRIRVNQVHTHLQDDVGAKTNVLHSHAPVNVTEPAPHSYRDSSSESDSSLSPQRCKHRRDSSLTSASLRRRKRRHKARDSSLSSASSRHHKRRRKARDSSLSSASSRHHKRRRRASPIIRLAAPP